MLFPSMRPTFREEMALPIRAVTDAVERGLSRTPNRVVGSVAGNVIELYPTRAERHVFSPRLSVVLYPRQGTLVVGRYGPNPDIWTFLVALYALAFFAAFGGALGAAAQALVGGAQTAWIGMPVGVVGALCVYVGALVGRRAAREQVTLLAAFFEACIDDARAAGSSVASAEADEA